MFLLRYRHGTIQLPLVAWRELATNATIAKAGTDPGGVLASDTTPILQRVNGATDAQLRIAWAATVVNEITHQFVYPADLDQSSPVLVKLLLYKNTNTDTTVTIGVKYFEDIGGTDLGGNTAAITNTTLAVVTKSITPATAKNVVSISLTPAAHGSDAIYLVGSYIAYTKKSI